MSLARNPLLLNYLLLSRFLLTRLLVIGTLLALPSVAPAQIPTFDNGPPLLSPGTDRSLTQLISTLQSSLKDASKPTDSGWAKLPKPDRASLVLRRAALSLATRADELGVNGHHHALAARILADAASNRADLIDLIRRVDESLIDHAAKEIHTPWPDDAAALSAELRRRLGIFVTGDESSLTWTGLPVSPAIETTGVESLDRGVRSVETAFAPTLPLAAFAPARNHVRVLLTRACLHAKGETGLSQSALTAYHSRFTALLNDLKQDPYSSAELETLVRSADLITLIFPPATAQPRSNADPLASLLAAERDSITRFALSSGSQLMSADRIDTARAWFDAMMRLSTTSAKTRPMPPPLKQLDKVITSRGLAAVKDASKGFVDLFRTQTSPRDPAVLAGISALRKAQADLDSLEELRTCFSTNEKQGDSWNDQFPLAAARFTKLGVEFQNSAKRDAALNTLRSWASGFNTAELLTPSLPSDPSCLATFQRVKTLARTLQERKKLLINQKNDPTPPILAALDQQITDLRTLAGDLRDSARVFDLPLAPDVRRLVFPRVLGLYLTESTFDELLICARRNLNTADAMLDQWSKGTPPSRAQLHSLRDELSLTAAIGRALPTAVQPGATPPHPLQGILCGIPTLHIERATDLAAFCRAVEAHVAAFRNKDANAMPLLNLAHSAAARVEGVSASRPNP